MIKEFKEIRDIRDINIFLTSLISLNSLNSLQSDSDNRNKPPFDKGRFGGNVNINGGVLDTTTILKATKVSFWETFVII